MEKLSNDRVSFDENLTVSEIDAELAAAGLERVGAPENVDGEVIYAVRAATVDNELIDSWLGRDWPESVTPAEAMRIATKCQAIRDAGDSRDYTEILAEVVAAS